MLSLALAALTAGGAVSPPFAIPESVVSVPPTFELAEPRQPQPAPYVLPSGLRLSLGSGVQVPFGSIDATRGSLASRAAWLLSLSLDLGYAIRRIYLGAYFEGSLGSSSGGEPECAERRCGFSLIRVGLESRYTLVEARVSPWIGYGVGFDMGQAENHIILGYRKTPTDLLATYSGIEWAHASVGVDIHRSDGLILTPFVGASLGTYSDWRHQVRTSHVDEGGTIDDQALHGTITVGLRASCVIAPPHG
jgi:hypothetical protein